MVSGGMLSQDEIDALLSGGTSSSAAALINEHLTEIEQDALGEIGNISFGSAATALSTLLNQKVEITTPVVSVIQQGSLKDEFPIPHVAVEVTYTAGIEGANMLVIKKTDAQIIADLMLGGDGSGPSPDFGELQLSAVGEAMNQMMGSASTSMSAMFGKMVDISPPSIDFLDVEKSNIPLSMDETLVKVSFRLKIGTLIDSNIMQLVQVKFAKLLVAELIGAEPEMPQAASEKAESPEISQASVQEEEYQEVHREATTRHDPYIHPRQDKPVMPASFTDFSDSSGFSGETKNLDMLLDIPLQVTVELGRTKKSIKEILELGHGSIIELDKLAGEPVDIYVNQKRIAKGEVVVIEENFGVRVTQILSQKDRLQKLK
ncbi:flagellar motor switch phosphatase FliY [Fictibacillus aquaticus]|uniref:Flagellar motor switch phosphatase FliY n=1 Tax=Fictibacillus aquaticus TaxID=2021314 RepID=A0A235FBX8_9BACL|nr:flagellar motor switch phosphatase FliY [Fictibacillus aquaticus]OYD58848.1 flagellar motor switch phosphatase FliY [Fictibacillus aquaticus]